MPCGLADYELWLLDKLYSRRCFTSNSSFNLLRLYKGFQRIHNKDVREVAKSLANKGYLTRKKKNDPKYFISDRPTVESALSLHDYDVASGRIRHL